MNRLGHSTPAAGEVDRLAGREVDPSIRAGAACGVSDRLADDRHELCPLKGSGFDELGRQWLQWGAAAADGAGRVVGDDMQPLDNPLYITHPRGVLVDPSLE